MCLPRSAANPLCRLSASLGRTISVIFISIASLSDLSRSSYFLLPLIPLLFQGATTNACIHTNVDYNCSLRLCVYRFICSTYPSCSSLQTSSVPESPKRTEDPSMADLFLHACPKKRAGRTFFKCIHLKNCIADMYAYWILLQCLQSYGDMPLNHTWNHVRGDPGFDSVITLNFKIGSNPWLLMLSLNNLFVICR